jgi:hypothetical protein
MPHSFSIHYCGNLDACRTEARIAQSGGGPKEALIAVVYESLKGFVVTYHGAALANPSLPGLESALAEARRELPHYINRRGDNRPLGITRPGLSLWLTERDDETVVGTPLK